MEGNGNEKQQVENHETVDVRNVLNLPEGISKMDAIRAYAVYKCASDQRLKRENLSAGEIEAEESLLREARNQCLEILTREETPCGEDCDEQECCENDCCNGCDCDEQECCNGCDCDEQECCNGCDCGEQECCNEQECDEQCCSGCDCNAQECNENCCDDEYNAQCCEGQECIEQCCNDCDEKTQEAVHSDIGMCSIEREDFKAPESPVVFEEVEDTKKGMCGLNWLCF